MDLEVIPDCPECGGTGTVPTDYGLHDVPCAACRCDHCGSRLGPVYFARANSVQRVCSVDCAAELGQWAPGFIAWKRVPPRG